jgi:hypothetical protein
MLRPGVNRLVFLTPASLITLTMEGQHRAAVR